MPEFDLPTEPLLPSHLELLQRAYLACDRDTRKKFLKDIRLGAPLLWSHVENEVAQLQGRKYRR